MTNDITLDANGNPVWAREIKAGEVVEVSPEMLEKIVTNQRLLDALERVK